MSVDSVDTIVMPDAAPAGPKPAAPRAALARLAFGSVPSSVAAHTLGPRHLAFLPPESLELDLSDPAQRTFGDYELIDKLGQGGMGVVYRAKQRSLEREVALKLLSAGPWASKDFIERFRREAQSAARMQHPNIVAIYEIGAHDELNFFSMRLVEGVSLAHQLQESGPLPPKRAAQLMRSIAEALDYAHRLGVLHLDLKPANVMIDERGEPQVADFGLARRLDETLTRDNDEVSGTPSYMAPEQAQIKTHKLSQATDIYGLGAILYELLTGRPPFLGSTPQDTLLRVISETPTALRHLQPTIPVDLEAICLKCLAKEPGERYASARALAEDLGRFVEGRQVSVRPLNTLQRIASWARREPRLAASAGLATLALVIGLLATTTQWQRADRNAEEARHTLWRMRSQAAQTALADADGFRGLRPLVANLAEMEAEGRTEDAAVERQRIGTVLANAPRLIDLVRFPQGTAVSAAAVAPDGRGYAIATHASDGKRTVRQYDLAGRELWSTSADDMKHLLVYGGGPLGRMEYAPDGSRIVVRVQDQPVFSAPLYADSLAFAAADGRLLVLPDLAYSDIEYSDDGSTGLVRFRENRRQRFPETGQLYDMTTGRPLGPRVALEPYEWLLSPDGRQLVGSGNLERFTAFVPATLAPRWHLQLTTHETVRAWRYSPDGALLALGCANGVVYLVDTRDGSRAALPSPPVAPIRWLEFSREGDAIVADAEDGSIAVWDVASRRPRVAPLQGAGGSKLRQVGDTLYRAAGAQIRSWALTPPAPFGDAAVPAPARIRSRRDFSIDAFDVRPEHRLLVAAGMDGQVGVWRLPPPVVVRAHAAPLPGRSLRFDGERLVAVEGASVQLRDVVTQAPRSAAFEHPEPVRYAELSSDGRTLVTIAGRTVRVLDPATGAERGEPIVLPQTPLRAELAREAPVFAVTTAAYTGDRLEETVHVIELDPVRLRGHALRVAGTFQRFELDPRGRYALATTVVGENQDLVRLDLAGDREECSGLGRGEGDEIGYVLDTAISDDGARAWVAASLKKRRTSLTLWSLADCKPLHSLTVPNASGHIKLHAMGGGVAVHQLVGDRISLFDADGQRREVPGGAAGRSMFDLAVSRDGRRAVIAERNSVKLIDLARGEPLSASLTAAIAGNDAIAKLAFSPDATRLLARTVKGRWLYWELPVATQPVTELARLAALLDPDGTSAIADDDSEALRRQLRAQDPLAHTEAPSAEYGTVTLDSAPGSDPDPRFVPLALGTAINAPLNGQWPPNDGTAGDAPTLAPGLQRFDGVDYRVDGGVQLSPGGRAFIIAPAYQPEPILVPGPPVSARRVHVLALMQAPIMFDTTFRFARVVLVDERGREFPLEIRTGRDVVTHWSPGAAASSARIAWSGIGSISVRGGEASSSETFMNVYAVALDIPELAGPIRSVRLQGGGELPVDAPQFFAITLEVDYSAPARPGGAAP